jgi:hypothetical protein
LFMASATPSDFGRFPSEEGNGCCIDPDWSTKKRKHDGFVRLISAA